MMKSNIIRVNSSSEERMFRCPDANHKFEKFAVKAIEKVIGKDTADYICNNYKRGKITNETLISDMYRNNPDEVQYCNCPNYHKALKLLETRLSGKEKLYTVHFTGVRMADINKNGSAELPYVNNKEFKDYVKGRYLNNEIENQSLTKGNGWNMILEKERVHVHQIKDGTLPFKNFLYDIRVHARSHLTTVDKDDKVRAVYGVPCVMILIELMLLWPLSVRIKQDPYRFIAWGYETFNGGLEKLRQRVTPYNYHISLDFETFDKRLPFWLFKDIHTVWQSLYQLGPYYEDDPDYPNPFTTPERIDNLWKFMYFYITKACYRAPDGSRYKRNHSGLPSGLYQTQLLGSCCNWLIIVSALLSLGIPYYDFDVIVMGDDSSINFNTEFDISYVLQYIANYARENFNAIINTEKCFYSVGNSELRFLKYKFKSGAVIRENDDLLAKLVIPEKANFDPRTTKARALGIMTANLGYNLQVDLVCRDILSTLSDVQLKTSDLDWYELLKLQYLDLDNVNIPDRNELLKLGLIPREYQGDENWTKFIRRPKLHFDL